MIGGELPLRGFATGELPSRSLEIIAEGPCKLKCVQLLHTCKKKTASYLGKYFDTAAAGADLGFFRGGG